MNDMEIARPLELELQKLFGENSYRLERRPCTGKYRGHTDYTLVFGSGRRLYVGLDQRNYLCFVEYNPEKEPGYELCVGVYCAFKDDTVYYDSYQREQESSSD